MFNDTLTLGISYKAPVWIQKARKNLPLGNAYSHC
jgi:hypothetical protein